MRTPLLALALAAGTAALTAAAAQTTPAPSSAPAGGMGMRGMGGLMRADANGDGVVTRAEATAQADEQFDRMDTNHDGKVTSDEMQAAFQAMRGGRGGRGGGGGGMRGMGADGTITKADFRARQLARFDRADTNHDGKVDQAEMDAMRQMRMQRRGGDDAAPAAGEQ